MTYVLANTGTGDRMHRPSCHELDRPGVGSTPIPPLNESTAVRLSMVRMCHECTPAPRTFRTLIGEAMALVQVAQQRLARMAAELDGATIEPAEVDEAELAAQAAHDARTAPDLTWVAGELSGVEQLALAIEAADVVEQLALALDLGDVDELPEATAPVPGRFVVIPCGRQKLDHAAPAGELYTGAGHRLARQAADAIAKRTGARVLILSAMWGLIELDRVTEPYDMTAGDRDAVSPEMVAWQLGRLKARELVTLTPKRYSALINDALLAASTTPALGLPLVQWTDVLAGSRGLLDQRARLAAVKRAGGVL